jgi:hypothetical protein
LDMAGAALDQEFRVGRSGRAKGGRGYPNQSSQYPLALSSIAATDKSTPLGPKGALCRSKSTACKVIDSISSPGNADLHQATRPERHPETSGYLPWRFMLGLRGEEAPPRQADEREKSHIVSYPPDKFGDSKE